jgi:diguanylate cyclase (GGDEF)-like protein
VNRKPAKPQHWAVALRPPQSTGLRGRAQTDTAAEQPSTSKSRPRPRSARLAAEVERLAAELEASRARITELEARIDIDPLTDTLNRRGFERELKRALAYVKRYGVSAALVYLDLDEFKPVNDRHGHAAGDAVLKAIAAALIRHVRASDVVARMGGDEFVVLLWNVNGADAVAKAAALEAAVYATPVRWGASTLVVGASAGVALIGPLDTPAEVLGRADAAMYGRKAERRRRHSGGGANSFGPEPGGPMTEGKTSPE